MKIALPILLILLFAVLIEQNATIGRLSQQVEQLVKPHWHGPSGKAFPSSWGTPPEIQTTDVRPLPYGYGHGSSTLYGWIMENMK